MAVDRDRPLQVRLDLEATPIQLLEVLDTLARLGVLSDDRVRSLCQQHLSVARPEASSDWVPSLSELSPRQEERDRVSTPPLEGKRRSPLRFSLTQWLDPLLSELSVRWLGFLGAFLVVLSSGVLAANFWEWLPAAGQYAVLLAYTMAFGLASQWLAGKNSLRLTSQTLQIVTLLLVPVNFWAMDVLVFWRSPWGLVVAAIAAVILAPLTWRLARGRSPTNPFLAIVLLVTSVLHWGWSSVGFSLLAVYAGTIVTAILALRLRPSPGERLPNAIAAYAVAILLGRSLFFVPIFDLGLAIGICGWLFAKLSPSPSGENKLTLAEKIGSVLLIFGWLVSVFTEPVLAIGVCGLILERLFDRLQRFWRRRELLAIFVVGWHIVYLIGVSFPASVRQSVVSTTSNWFAIEGLPSPLLGLGWFPYIIAWLIFTHWIEKQDRAKLARFGDRIALGFGISLAAIASPVAGTRCLNLLLSTVTLGFITVRRYPRSKLAIYLTHASGLLTVISAISWIFSDLPLYVWAMVSLGLACIEWIGSTAAIAYFARRRVPYFKTVRLAYNSAAIYGLILAIFGYFLFGQDPHYSKFFGWSFALISPAIVLTAIARISKDPKRKQIALLSDGFLVFRLLIPWEFIEVLLASIGVSIVLMHFNTYYSRNRIAASATVGLYLLGITLLFANGIFGIPPLSARGWLLAGAIVPGILWILYGIFRRKRDPISQLYSPALNEWAIAVCSLEILVLTFESLLIYQGLVNPDFIEIAATAILIGVIIYRYWKQFSNLAFYSLAWAIELFVVMACAFFENSLTLLTVANIGLGLGFQLLGDRCQKQQQGETVPQSWHVIPFAYGILGSLLRVERVTAWTGFVTLGLAFITIGISRRSPQAKFLTYIGLFGISASAYELLWYRTRELGVGDELIAIAALGIAIAHAYRLLMPFLIPYLKLAKQQIGIVAHLHWLAASLVLIVAINYPIVANKLLAVGTGVLLARYAIFQGRNPDRYHIGDLWVYLGVAQSVSVITYIAYQLEIGQFLLPWVGAIAALSAYFFYFLPWENWGWRKHPWQRSSLVLPVVAAFLSANSISLVSLVLIAIVYGVLSYCDRNIRLSYFSLFFLTWFLWQWWDNLQLTSPIWYASPACISILYIARVDPALKQRRSLRHSLRLLATVAWDLIAFTTAPWFIAVAIATLQIFAGLALRVRAFLFVGTGLAIAIALDRLVFLGSLGASIRWSIGLSIGILALAIAAGFETRRDRISRWVRHWFAELEHWQ